MILRRTVQENGFNRSCFFGSQRIPQGRLYAAVHGRKTFECLSQFLVKIENILEENRILQSYTAFGSFSAILPRDNTDAAPGERNVRAPERYLNCRSCSVSIAAGRRKTESKYLQ